ncbi:hypothetical protein L210DRAFT_3420560 [Boletus edulis BED1]|uniref:Uncharacterized protein n=1 Tax=Boletus edulis BED1 TaxID=1328754 RepID=A0AAD4BGC1_BOLED|nr:hypothetical protein L210DRAFT_3420560 [Boletus edulis BED1]
MIHLDGLHSSKSRGQRQKLARLDDALVTQPPVDHPDSYDGVEWFECHARTDSVRIVQTIKASTGVSDLVSSSSRSTGNSAEPAKIKAVFRRHRTNNEQLVVRPCGIINGRSTMYHHEAISNVLVMIQQLYSLARARKPQHLIYDSNCNALREVQCRHLSFFQDMGMCVDTFHHRTKHKVTDTLCQEKCNMRAYPELLDDDGKFYFNSSIAEQTNVWFGAFHNICQEMTPTKYDFFLDEMILRRNRVTLATLQARGKRPYHPPISTSPVST